VLKPVEGELLFGKLVVAGIAVSEVASVDVLVAVLTEAKGGTLLVAWGTELFAGVVFSDDGASVVAVDEFTDGGAVAAGECVSVEGTTVDVFILGGVGGVGLVGGVGNCMGKPPFGNKLEKYL